MLLVQAVRLIQLHWGKPYPTKMPESPGVPGDSGLVGWNWLCLGDQFPGGSMASPWSR